MADLHLIEEDLDWFQYGIPEQVLVYETEQYLAKQAELARLYPEPDSEPTIEGGP